MSHIIRRQFLQIELNGSVSDGLTLQRSLPELCRHWLMPALEKVLDRCAPHNEHLLIERLEIDAGTIQLDRLEHDLTAEVAQALEHSLRQRNSTGESTTAKISGRVTVTSEQQNIYEAFIYFLKTGRLPWSFRLPAKRNLEEVILDLWQPENFSSPEIRFDDVAIFETLRIDSARKRMVRQFSRKFLDALIQRLSPTGKKSIAEILDVLPASNLSAHELNSFERSLWETLFHRIAMNLSIDNGALIVAVWKKFPPTPDIHFELKKNLETRWPELGIQPDFGPSREIKKVADAEIAQENFSETAEAEVKEGLFVEDAGLVLLHPFLPQFFRALEIADDEKILQPDRALVVLHYLATGNITAHEYELTLPKILCNISLETPVELIAELNDSEKEEADALLSAVINHWETLKNTSPDGLRSNFLRRAGKIFLREDDDWNLQVESNSFDILLDRLPWSIGLIKLPWMPRLLWVEWA